MESDPDVLRWLPPGYPITRVQVNAQAYPWRSIGRVTTYGGQQYCTGTLVGERLVLTAAHCVWRLRQFPSEINFLAGFQRNQYVAHAKAQRLHFAPNYAGPPTSPAPHDANPQALEAAFGDDWALVELGEPIGQQVGFLDWLALDEAQVAQLGGLAQAQFAISGYRSDRAFVQTVDHGCRLAGFTAAGRLIVHDCPLMPGDSGGPILLAQNGQYRIVGMDVAGVPDKTSVVPALRNQPRMKRGFAVPMTNLAATFAALKQF
ncbi:trypsin-like serine protease [Rhodoferax sp. 4810]|nr:trypsin-like serine protease [Rhodoferax jenense]